MLRQSRQLTHCEQSADMRRSHREERTVVSTLSHIREIERVAMGDASSRDVPVIQSWLRCLHDYQLDPTEPQEA